MGPWNEKDRYVSGFNVMSEESHREGDIDDNSCLLHSPHLLMQEYIT